MRSSLYIFGVAVACTLGRRAAGHPLCYYEDRSPDPEGEHIFCPVQAEGTCCTTDEEAEAIIVFNAVTGTGSALSDDCAALYREVACGPCHSYSSHLYERLGAELGPEDGMTMKSDFCEELVSTCAGEIDFPTYDGDSYCEKHVGDSEMIWSFPIDEEELTFESTGLVEAFEDLDSSELPSDLICMHMTPDGDEWWLGGQDGQLVSIPADGATSSTLILDISSGADLVVAYEEGLLDFAFSPAYNTNSYFYVSYTIEDAEGTKNRLARFTQSSTTAATFASLSIVLDSEAKSTSIHSAGWIGFKPSDYESPSSSTHDIYWAIGDGGPQLDTENNGQDTSNILASIVRVSVPSGTAATDVGYTIPSGNVAGAICANGFRNPFRCGFDSETDDLYCGDVGHTLVEEIDIVECGNNYGWAQFEGSRCHEAVQDSFEPCDGVSRSGFTFPTFEYCHPGYDDEDEGEDEFTAGVDICRSRAVTGNAVIGGHVYHGQRFSDVLDGAYIFSDAQAGNIFYLKWEDGDWMPGTIISDGTASIISFAEDNMGELYVITAEREPFQLPCGDLCATTCLDQAEADPSIESLGCFADVNNDRALSLQQAPSCDEGQDEMSPLICASYCATISGAVYSGVEYAYQCFCGAAGEDYDKHGSLDESYCATACTGNVDETCGGFAAIEVFIFQQGTPAPVPPTPVPPTPENPDPPQLTPSPASVPMPTPITPAPVGTTPVTPAPVGPTPTTPAPAGPTPATPTPVSPTPGGGDGYTYLDCVTDVNADRVLSGASTTSSSMTAEFCAAYCEGSQYFGTQYSFECFCSATGDVYDEYGTASAVCDYACTGDSSEICGGKNAMSVYEYDDFSGPGPTPAPVAPTPSTDYSSLGCYVDSNSGRVLTGMMTSSSSMTTEACYELCPGSQYFGTEYYSQCFCSSVGDDYEELGAAPGSCTFACTGDATENCGGYNAISVYENLNYVAASPSSNYLYQGCFIDDKSNRIMGSKTSSSDMTADVCATSCAGFTYFGTQYGNECWCSNSADYATLWGEALDSECDMTCAGDVTEICGGYNLMTVYESI